MKIADALQLLGDGHPNRQYGFSMCYLWAFEVDGKNYFLTEMKGLYVRLETADLPRTLLDEILTKGDDDDG